MKTTDLYIEMCRKSPIQKDWKPNIGKVISVIWKENSSTTGLSGVIIQERPTYGVGYEFIHDNDNIQEKWYIYNGFINNIQCKMRICDNPDFEELIWLPRQEDWQELIYKSGKIDCICSACFLVKLNKFYNGLCESLCDMNDNWDDLQNLWCMFYHHIEMSKRKWNKMVKLLTKAGKRDVSTIRM